MRSSYPCQLFVKIVLSTIWVNSRNIRKVPVISSVICPPHSRDHRGVHLDYADPYPYFGHEEKTVYSLGGVQMTEKQQRRRFDAQFKLDALRLIEDHNRKITDVARELGMRPELLYRWKSEHTADLNKHFRAKAIWSQTKNTSVVWNESLHRPCRRDILKKALAYFSKKRTMKYQFHSRTAAPDRRQAFVCCVTGVPQRVLFLAAVRYFCTRDAESRTGETLAEIHQRSHRTYGSPRLCDALRHRVFAAITACCTFNAFTRHSSKDGTSIQGHDSFAFYSGDGSRLSAATFIVHQPNRVWTSDITYIWTREGWIYLAVVLDLCSRMIVGWEVSSRLTASIVTTAVQRALYWRQPSEDLILHSDRGSQYASTELRSLPKNRCCTWVWEEPEVATIMLSPKASSILWKQNIFIFIVIIPDKRHEQVSLITLKHF